MTTTAIESLMPSLNDLQARVLARFKLAGKDGLTSAELHRQYFLGYPESTSRTRISELVRKGLLCDSGQTRRSVAGRQMTVWVVA